jgi:vitamin K-dependent gamma-carboxylase
MPIKLWLQAKSDYWLIGPLIAKEPVAWFMAYGGLTLDLTAAFLMLGKKTRKYAFAAVVFFHFCNLLIFNIGIFPWLSVALTALFFPPDFPLKIIDKFKKGTSIVSGFITRKIILKFKPLTLESNAQLWQSTPRWRYVIVACLTLVLLVHVTLPLRHHFFEGNVVWTEEGHRYAWRMMLRAKRGKGTFKVEDALTGKIAKVSPKDYLTKRQDRNIYTHPDMIWEFAQFLEKEYRAKGWEPKVYADIFCRVNGSHYFRFVDKEVDLAAEPWYFFKHSHWIIPLKQYK